MVLDGSPIVRSACAKRTATSLARIQHTLLAHRKVFPVGVGAICNAELICATRGDVEAGDTSR